MRSMLGDVARALAGVGAQHVDRDAARQLREPRPDRGVVAQAVQLLVGAGEDLLEGVLGGVLGSVNARVRIACT